MELPLFPVSTSHQSWLLPHHSIAFSMDRLSCLPGYLRQSQAVQSHRIASLRMPLLQPWTMEFAVRLLLELWIQSSIAVSHHSVDATTWNCWVNSSHSNVVTELLPPHILAPIFEFPFLLFLCHLSHPCTNNLCRNVADFTVPTCVEPLQTLLYPSFSIRVSPQRSCT